MSVAVRIRAGAGSTVIVGTGNTIHNCTVLSIFGGDVGGLEARLDAVGDAVESAVAFHLGADADDGEKQKEPAT